MKRLNSAPAFSLPELMVTIAIIVALIAVSGPAVTGLLKGSRLTGAGEVLLGQLVLARQQSLSENRSIELRFYGSGTPREVTAYQTIVFNEAGLPQAFSQVQRLPKGIFINPDPEFSSLLSADRQKNWTTEDPCLPLADVGTNYEAWAFLFRPDGGTDLPPGAKWFLTLDNVGSGAAGVRPKNFFTISLDPANGRPRSFRP